MRNILKTAVCTAFAVLFMQGMAVATLKAQNPHADQTQANTTDGKPEKQVGSSGKPAIDFKIEEHDFHKVRERGRKVSCDFVFQNTGTAPLVITRTITSCRCVDTSFTKRPVPPGGQGMVKVTYDPKKQEGVFHKAIQVFTNTDERMHIVVIKGEVIQD